MFLRNSRYYEAAKVEANARGGRTVVAVKRRRLPSIEGQAVVVQSSDQLDVTSERRYRDPTRFWHIGDANSELEVNELVRSPGRVIEVPES